MGLSVNIHVSCLAAASSPSNSYSTQLLCAASFSCCLWAMFEARDTNLLVPFLYTEDKHSKTCRERKLYRIRELLFC